jgi:hypothetical protein
MWRKETIFYAPELPFLATSKIASQKTLLFAAMSQQIDGSEKLTRRVPNLLSSDAGNRARLTIC